jgi:hypothetical protein
VQKEDGTVPTNQKDSEKEVVTYFGNLFKCQEDILIIKQLEVLQNYPRLFLEEEGKSIVEPVLFSEVLSTLKGFAKSKNLGRDGWIVDFFLEFFDILGHNILEAVEESRIKGKIIGALNATYITLIPKSDKLESFDGLRPIFLCNLLYKVI